MYIVHWLHNIFTYLVTNWSLIYTYKVYILKYLLHTILLDLVKSICKYNQLFAKVTERINRGSVLCTTLALQHIYIPTKEQWDRENCRVDGTNPLPPDFGRSFNPIPSREGGRLCHQISTSPQTFRPSAGSEL